MKILFVHNGLRRFVKLDLEILQSTYDVKIIEYSSRRSYLSEIIAGVEWCDLVFGWWATWHMLLPSLGAYIKNKPVIVVGGDYDIIFDRKYRTKKRLVFDKLRNWLGYILFPLIDNFIVFSSFSESQALKLPYIKKDKVNRIYLGVPDIARGISVNKKDNLVLSVGSIHQYDVYRKGYKAFVQSANYLPDYQYVLAGPWKDESISLLRSWNNRNVSYPGFLSDDELYYLMCEAKVYAQVSLHEGFGMALAEAMLCQCIPVITNQGSIPEVVGDCGFYVPYGDLQKTADAIRQACSDSSDLGIRARERILSIFPIENRKVQLLQVFEEASSNKR